MAKKIFKVELRTPAEIRRDERDAALCNEYNVLLRQQPTAKPYRLFAVLADKYTLSKYGIAKILKRHGVYQPNV